MWCHPSDQKTRQSDLSPNRDVNVVFLSKYPQSASEPGAALIWAPHKYRVNSLASIQWKSFPSVKINNTYVDKKMSLGPPSTPQRAVNG